MNVFDRALDIIREKGWCQFTLQHVDGRVCLLGALSLAVRSNSLMGWNNDDINLADEQAKKLFPLRYTHGAVSVNNHDETTQEDVELILKHCSFERELQE